MSCSPYFLRRVGAPRVLPPLLLPFLLLTTPRPAAPQQPPPDEAWRQFDTEHFTVTYPERMAALARHAGAAAERAFGLLEERFVDAPRGRVQLLLTDHADISNGYATPRPFNQITVFARPPMDGGSLGYYDDWLELVITHEIVHTFHLDMTGAIGKVIRGLFGRPPALWPVFPSAAAPTWMLEGLATYYESELTGAGRVKGTWQEMVMRASALEGSLPGLGQVTGDSPVWPAGNRPYVYGARYMRHMAEVHGEESLAEFARTVAGLWVPYRMDAAARGAFGVSVGASWEAWANETTERYRALAEELDDVVPLTVGETVDGSGRLAGQPVVSPDGGTLAFLRSDGVSQPQIRAVELDGGRARRLARVNGTGGTLSWAGDGALLFTQLDFSDRYRVTSDLYRAGRDGSVERMTRGQRISYADVAPDGSRAVAVREGGGSNALVLVALPSGEVTPLVDAEPGRHWAFPRWSPDGTRIAVVRWVRAAMMDIVILDAAGEVVTEVTRDRAVDTAPSWSPDGTTVLWSSDRTGIPNLYAATLGGGANPEIRQVTNVLGGATHPSVDPRGRWIHYASYHADGWHLERIPFAPADWFAPQPMNPRFVSGPATAPQPAATPDSAGFTPRRYRPFSTLRPYYWSPLYQSAEKGTDMAGGTRTVFQPFVGILTGGSDLVGRHSYALATRWTIDASRFAGSLSYNYAGLGNPVLGVSAAQRYDATSRTIGVPDQRGDRHEFFLVEQERSLSLSSSFVRLRYRHTTALTLSAGVVAEHLSVQHPDGRDGPALVNPRTNFTDLRATLSFSNTQRRALSFSREEGVRGYVSWRQRLEQGLDSDARGAIGQDRGYGEFTGDLSAFKALGRFGFANHVLATRLSAGAASGPGADQFHFDIGDAEGQPETFSGFGLFGGARRLFPIRGYPSGYRSGKFAWSWSAEYRFPVAILDRGFGAWPLFLDRLHGSVFLDGGNAWGPTLGESRYDNPQQPALWSTGVEASMIVAPLYLRGTSLRVGAGFPLVEGDGPVFYLRIGNAF
ncbi:MAG: hypothetical protein OXI71_07295 [Gemmatimonadota bacterium]|nr:hypothetical protein [Gemmatimonadota bacterium]MDE2679056.1 hypothetical protein [Gemmatimonadota bacterium]